MGNEDILISKLTEETYTGSADREESDNCVDLRKYFEKRLNHIEHLSINDYLDQHHLSRHVLEHKMASSCFRLIFKESILDFPSNWSIFAEIKGLNFLYLDQSQDVDFLLEIFAELSGSFQNVILIKEHGEVQLVFLPDETSFNHVKWIESFFEKNKNKNSMNNRNEENKAA